MMDYSDMMSYSDWMEQVERLIGVSLGPEKWVLFFSIWFEMKAGPEVGVRYYRKVLQA